ncbi:4-hydroxy-tetrahydrodipicolinate reductase [Yeosuana sp. MJ-SS3]|uniref:4-hydroxy-tetrahydrodipicolinate reductase n=1 Tax=Gilvirhabdus luticola TaxID=3079858 RepID=A0ABU3U809_9FLAO|nr:4-hydroxy-tetrahydrodipicolinate reductase [Yeosuana sp. MJ-SS3]MDU8886552.1 4-hydroxy-tetrahydrodipicolinate reductase [Yeosuana sp. MJ-SS3]
MKLAILGYGKMGKTIERIAKDRGHNIVIIADVDTVYNITKADVAIDFSVPTVALNNISNCLNNNVPVISGTTGWLQDFDKAVSLCKEKNGAFIYASNYSLGVNIFFELNKVLAKMMSNLSQYNIDIEEIHHTQKLDAPSGTAISLANDIIKEHSKYNQWSLSENVEGSIPITAKRIENVPGTHTINYESNVDSISIKHTAYSRDGFALGAVIAAEWILDKTGVFSMKDVLNIS